MQHKFITFVGGGNMAQAIVFGLLKRGYPAENITVCDPNEEKQRLFASKGVRVATDNVAAVSSAEVVLLAVKPQVLAEVCVPLSAVDFSDKFVISIAAGVSLARLTALLPTATSIVRVMPNTPALVGEGMAGLFAAKTPRKTTALLRRIYCPRWAKPFGLIRKRKCTRSLRLPGVARPIFSNFQKPCNKA
ncbi:Pyrroline-5-carboxylate reductase [Aggregatibacter aphrophilus]|uniref:Pyrroline-5-carboxylate reductase n=1 Tax=Aggregatibacter aphrophilus TaxID=732 RepID=A0A336N684_AGGAP|nr:Pyrroline-5-carboxylate reductase [Aggregatibacter aphrophilus]